MSVQHNTLTKLELHQPFNADLDANKPATCAVGDFFFATDKDVLYQCLATDTWTIKTARKSATFVNGDLTTGKLTVTHNWNTKDVEVLVLDNNDEKVYPDTVTVSANSVEIDLTGFGALTGTWRYKIFA